MKRNIRRKKEDVNTLAHSLLEQVTSEHTVKSHQKNPHAVSLGRLGGLKGGNARAKNLSPERRKEIARKAALSRWENK